jgi:hypothetical protein
VIVEKPSLKLSERTFRMAAPTTRMKSMPLWL